jgi:Family of unknown function (DUF5683)
LNSLKLSVNHIIKIAVLLLLLSQIGFAQQDTSSINSRLLQDSTFVMQKSPWGAVLRSAIIPGWGQFYNQSYLTIPVIWGLSAWFIYNYNFNNKEYKLYKNLYIQTPSTNLESSAYKNNRDFYRDQRDLFAIYFGLTYFLNLVDAYVDAELFDFSVKQDMITKRPMLNMKVRF